MYEQFYGLRDHPFSLTPDPKYLFRTESLLEVFANLQYGIETGKGIVVVTGEVGTGKTTILRTLLQSLDQSVLAAYIFNPYLKSEEFFESITTAFSIIPQSSKAATLRVIDAKLNSRNAQGLRTLVVIDEAHGLSSYLFEEIRLLSNFETNREKLLQVILCGQPELHDMLSLPALRHLKQRISLKCSLKPLTPSETGEYIRWRLRIAGCANEHLFEPEAVRLAHRFSDGIPRIINNICDNALLIGFSEGSPCITASIISEVCDSLELTLPSDAIPPVTDWIITDLLAAVSNAKTRREPEEQRYDLFLSHASEDKDAIARPLYLALVAKGVSVWFDEAVLELGDNLRRKIDSALATCRFGVVILSPRFLSKQWPQDELDGLAAREKETGEKAILPIWHELDRNTVLRYSPPLADRVAGRSDEGIDALVAKILRVLKK